MIKLTGINKIYRTNEIETVALENVNLEVNKGEFRHSCKYPWLIFVV